jgi:predicted NUDIX family NTP pyrophosphohydrolase
MPVKSQKTDSPQPHSTSAGLLMFRRGVEGPEVFLVHPGGPWWANKDAGAWSIPKGEPDEGEQLVDTARREFQEETGVAIPDGELLPLGEVKQKAGKVVHAWAFEGDCDPARIVCNTFKMQYPPGSGQWRTFPEVDRAAFFDLAAAREKINPAQAAFLDRLRDLLGAKP